MYIIIGVDRWGRLFEMEPKLTHQRAYDICMRLNHKSVQLRSGCVYDISQILDV